jgi:hypothetical protein
MREEYWPRVLESRVLKKVFGLKRSSNKGVERTT